MKKIILLLLLIACISCQKKEIVDILVVNANVYTVNDTFENAEAFAVKDGKFVEIGNSNNLKLKFKADTIINAQGKTIVPGFIDAHCHFLGLGLNQLNVDLTGTTSFDEVVNRVTDFQNKRQQAFIYGRGWDQNDWDIKEFPNNALLNSLFPNTPVVLERVDGMPF